jgi:protein-S-isoprenylcysteine O-methyltransferase Ste14
MNAPPLDHSEPVVFPPVIPVAGFLLGVLLERVWPTTAWLAGPVRTGLRGFGAIAFCVGTAGFAWMVATMKKAGTPIHNAQTPTVLVDTGPFGLTRNPMYLFGSIAYAGLALMLAKWWSLALLPLVTAATHYGVIRREEVFLERHFGDAYKRYEARVGRYW